MKDAIAAFLSADYPWKDRLHYLPSADSTNTRLKAMAAQGAPHGTVLIAGHQTGGRGRMGRSFHSPAGKGIYMSILLRPDCPPTELMHLTCAAAAAMCDAVENAAGFRPGIKWTNDLVYARRKLAGILTELSLNPAGKVDYAVIGIGINCCQQPHDFPPEIRDIAGSLTSVTGRPVDPARVAAAMADSLWQMDRELLSGKTQMLDRYRAACVTLGQEISLLRGEEVRHGKALDIDDAGGLIVEFGPGVRETVTSGEVSIRGMYGYL